MVAEQSAGAMADVEQTPLPDDVESSGGGIGGMESIIKGLQARLQNVNFNIDDPYKLKPIDKKGHQETQQIQKQRCQIHNLVCTVPTSLGKSTRKLRTRVQRNYGCW